MTVTGLGRAIGGIAREKHNIKRADRLLSEGYPLDSGYRYW
jgi:hypothetical protein